MQIIHKAKIEIQTTSNHTIQINNQIIKETFFQGESNSNAISKNHDSSKKQKIQANRALKPDMPRLIKENHTSKDIDISQRCTKEIAQSPISKTTIPTMRIILPISYHTQLRKLRSTKISKTIGRINYGRASSKIRNPTSTSGKTTQEEVKEVYSSI